MKKLLYTISLAVTTAISYAFADTAESRVSTTNSISAIPTTPVIVNPNNIYIDRQAYIQDPYAGVPSKGGTQNVSESTIATQTVWQKWFEDGTWNSMSMFGYANTGGFSNYSYSENLFGQTGQVAGFSFGGLFTANNLIPPNGANPPWGSNDQFLPTNQVVQAAELFLEYQYNNIIEVDIGRIGINNSPWLSQAYYNNMDVPGMTYQGALVNVNPGGGWLLTGVAFNQILPVSATGFNNLTMYNSGFDYGTGTTNLLSNPSSGTLAIGGNFVGDNNNYNLRIWAYNFSDYANLFYADNSLKLPVNQDTSFTLSAQVGKENDTGNSIIEANGDGQVDSTFFGLQAAMNYSWFGLTLAMNSLTGATSSYLQGGLVSPYTYEIATDPLYTTSFMMGMVEKGGGTAYKITPSFSFMDNKFTIAPSYAYYDTTDSPASTEYDLLFTYNVSQIKGLLFILDGAYMTQQPYNTGFGLMPVMSNGNAYVVELGTSYLY